MATCSICQDPDVHGNFGGAYSVVAILALLSRLGLLLEHLRVLMDLELVGAQVGYAGMNQYGDVSDVDGAVADAV